MLVDNIFCCVYLEEVPEDSSLSGEEEMLSLSSNSSGTFTEPVVLEVGSGHSQGFLGVPSMKGNNLISLVYTITHYYTTIVMCFINFMYVKHLKLLSNGGLICVSFGALGWGIY